MHVIVLWLASALIFYAVAAILPGVKLKGYGTALVVAAVFGVLNAVLGHFLVVLGTIITLPAILLTFGLFYFVVRLAVNTFLLWLTDKMVADFSIATKGSLWLASMLISVLQHVVFQQLHA